MIEEVKRYSVEGKTFDTKQQAQAYLSEQENKKVIVISSGPDLTEGRYRFSKQETFVVSTDFTKPLKIGQTIETLKKLIELVLSSKKPLYDGVMGTIQLMPTFTVEIKDYEYDDKHNYNFYTSYNVKFIKYDKEVMLNEIPYMLEDAITYVKELLNSSPTM